MHAAVLIFNTIHAYTNNADSDMIRNILTEVLVYCKSSCLSISQSAFIAVPCRQLTATSAECSNIAVMLLLYQFLYSWPYNLVILSQ